jgi:hypothetical protein
VLRVDALVRAGDGVAASRVARAFLVTSGDGPYAERVRRIVRSLAAAGAATQATEADGAP